MVDLANLDAVSVVLGALAAGAGEGVKDFTKNAVSHGPGKLVALIRDRLRTSRDPVGDAKLTVYEAEPTPDHAEALRGHLVEAGVDQDSQIVDLARQILTQASPSAVGPGSVAAAVLTQINRDGGTGFIGGSHTHHHGQTAQSGVAWDVRKSAGSGFELHNVGDAQAMELSVGSNVALNWPSPPPPSLHPGSAVLFICEPSMADPHPVLEVTWRDQPGQQRTWTRPLPR